MGRGSWGSGDLGLGVRVVVEVWMGRETRLFPKRRWER